ncbi:hypothetical protein R2APBS1_3208 [Rhodanobacter denitrificans]|uniref:Uncharacterized protein n=1 Tax=Rhodanobacter denitrificans TaxID=666685 RepID=M4NKR4_9GAMM|nr:hypothetical protein R2APBS1_3208 [Rhodanobacter denitrificans]
MRKAATDMHAPNPSIANGAEPNKTCKPAITSGHEATTYEFLRLVFSSMQLGS